MNWIKKHELQVILLCVLTLAVILFFFPVAPLQPSDAPFVRDTALEKQGLMAQARISSNALEKGEKLRYSLVFYNIGKSDIEDLCVSVNAPGFSGTDKLQQCPGRLAGEASVSVQGELEALSSGQYRISAFYAGKVEKKAFQSVISVGPVEMTSQLGKAAWLRFARRLKDLTLPVVLALLGYFFQKRQGQREERHQVRQIILPFVHALAEKHYMPIVRISVLFIKNFNKWTEETNVGQKELILELCFYDFILFVKRMDYLRQDKGQIFFQSKQGEQIARTAWSETRKKLESVFTEQGKNKLERSIGISTDYLGFRKKYPQFNQGPQFVAFRNFLADADFSLYLNLIDLIQAVFRCEANRPFSEHWYREESLDIQFQNSDADFPTPNRHFPPNTPVQSKDFLDSIKAYLQGLKVQRG